MARELYIMECGSRTIMGYIDPDELKGEGEEILEVADMEFMEIEYPAAVTMQMVPVQGNIATPNNQQQMGIGLVVLPYYVPRLVILVSSLIGYAKVPEKSELHQEAKRIASFFLSEKPDQGVQTFPRIVK